MFILIETCNDGCFEPVAIIGFYNNITDARAAMLDRIAVATQDYTSWRGIEFDEEFNEDELDYACRGYDGDGIILSWQIYDTDTDCTVPRYGNDL